MLGYRAAQQALALLRTLLADPRPPMLAGITAKGSVYFDPVAVVGDSLAVTR
jgi:hypothetical protein